MKIKGKSYTINLVKVDSGYRFESAGYLTDPKNDRKKYPNPLEKNGTFRASTRLARELSLGSQLPSVSQEPAAPFSADPLDQIQANIDASRENEDAFPEFRRETQLPESPAKWFSLQQVHQIQRAKLPQFFNSKGYKSSELYCKLRNFIVNLYRENPTEYIDLYLRYLTKITSRRILRGDVSMIIRIHNFLESEGIINFGLSLDGLHSFKSSFISKTPEIQNIPQSTITQVPEEDDYPYDLTVDTDYLTFSVVNKPFSRTFRVYCVTCKLICGISWYFQKQRQQTTICFDCYQTLDPTDKELFSSVDMLERINALSSGAGSAERNKRVSWSIDDNMKLLQFMSDTGHQWNQVLATFEGKKTIEDIILQFMQFPITNFIPNKQDISIKQNYPTDYSSFEHISILDNYYQNSKYGQRQQQCDPEDDIFPESDQSALLQLRQGQYRERDGVSNIVSLLLTKYLRKFQNCKLIEQTIEKGKDIVTKSLQGKKLRQPQILEHAANNFEFNRGEFDDNDSIFPRSDNDNVNIEGGEEHFMDIKQDEVYADMLNLGGDSVSNGE